MSGGRAWIVFTMVGDDLLLMVVGGVAQFQKSLLLDSGVVEFEDGVHW